MREEKRYYAYIMASRSLTLYTGVTGDLYHRALQHKAGEIEGFTKKYHINRLVYYETFKYVNNAIAREKQIKAWTRVKRLALIKTMNPAWQDLAEGWGELTELQIPRFARDDKTENNDNTENKEDNSQVEAGSTGATDAAPLQRKAKTA
ncbi:MAG TPA: GIY-YIG nuclease family protein [Terriglobales bacterium]|nr:GIY-YIG nuclease family protein [Terriglobales bacterium]